MVVCHLSAKVAVWLLGAIVLVLVGNDASLTLMAYNSTMVPLTNNVTTEH